MSKSDPHMDVATELLQVMSRQEKAGLDPNTLHQKSERMTA